MLDLWAREHFKSTIITFGLSIQDILSSHGECPDPKWGGREVTIGIFSHSRPIAKGFLRQIKYEFEANDTLRLLYPDIVWDAPKAQAPKWSEDDGLILRRRSNPKESTVEAWGLVDGQPTSKHFFIRVYDDVVTKESVTTPEMIRKVTESWELSLNLGAEGGIERTIGTRYAVLDTYSTMIEREAATQRIFPGTDNGLETGNPVLMTPQALAEKRRKMGPTTFAAQILQRPITKQTATFDIAHLRFTDIRPATLNIYIMGDPAGSRKKDSDKTAIAVVGIDAARNRYLVDGIHDKLNLGGRWKALRTLYRRWRAMPGVLKVSVGWERYGLQSDAEYFDEQMKRDKQSFEIVELAWPREGPGSKADRIQRLRPEFEDGRWFMPVLVWRDGTGLAYARLGNNDGEDCIQYEKAVAETARMRKVADLGQKWRIMRPIKHTDHEGRIVDVTTDFIAQYSNHPAPGAHDDILDATSRLYDMDAVPPVIVDEGDLEPAAYAE